MTVERGITITAPRTTSYDHQVAERHRVDEVPDLTGVVRNCACRDVGVRRPDGARQLLSAHPDWRLRQLGPPNAHNILGLEGGQVAQPLTCSDHLHRHDVHSDSYRGENLLCVISQL